MQQEGGCESQLQQQAQEAALKQLRQRCPLHMQPEVLPELVRIFNSAQVVELPGVP